MYVTLEELLQLLLLICEIVTLVLLALNKIIRATENNRLSRLRPLGGYFIF